LVGTATQLPAGQLYPVISFANNTESATVNFGATPLSFLPAGSASWDGSQTRAGGGGATTVRGFVCSGDSLTGGYVADAGTTVVPYPTQLANLTGLPAANFGANGWRSYQTDGNYPTREGPAYNAATANVLILEIGVNDIFAGNRSASDIDASVRSFCAQGRATGYRVYLMTIAAAGLTGAGESERQAVNADRRANWASYCDGLIDIAANPVFSDSTNRTYYQSDSVHWTTAADAVVANLVKTALLG
jgi:lysophospholipase L1-like esterase